MCGPLVFCPKVSNPVVKLAHGVWTKDYPIDRGKKNVKKTCSVKFLKRRIYIIRKLFAHFSEGIQFGKSRLHGFSAK